MILTYEIADPILVEDEWFDELSRLLTARHISPSNINRERWITHYNQGATPEQAVTTIMGVDAYERLCSSGVHCQGLCHDHTH
jgi:hypothetical protein